MEGRKEGVGGGGGGVGVGWDGGRGGVKGKTGSRSSLFDGGVTCRTPDNLN